MVVYPENHKKHQSVGKLLFQAKLARNTAKYKENGQNWVANDSVES
jgi:hypothetical protein